jgi:hypothetical protein
VRFNLRTTDAAGPLGAGVPHKPWRIVRSVTEQESLSAEESILSGKADGQGLVTLTVDQEKILVKQYNKHPNELWFIHGHKVKSLALTIQSDAWTDQQKRDHAFDAMGYSDTLGATGINSKDGHLYRLVRDEHTTSQADALLNKIKG